MSTFRLEAIALTWSMESLDTPIFSATLCALRVLAPAAYISTMAATRHSDALASLDHVLREEAALAVASRLFAPASHTRSASASITAFSTNRRAAQQLLHVDGAVFEPGHGKHVRRQVW